MRLSSSLAPAWRLLKASRWLFAFYLPMLAVAVVSTVWLRQNSARIDAALLEDTRTIAVATRCGTLSESLAKSLFLIERSVRDQLPLGDAIYELQRSGDRLDQIVNCFNDGGEAVAPDGSRIMIRPVTDQQAQAILLEINTIWLGIKGQTDRIIRLQSQKRELTVPLLREASEFVFAQQVRFSEQTLAFSKRLELVLRTEGESLNTLQTRLSLLSAVAWLSLPAVFTIRRAHSARRRADKVAAELGESKQELEMKATELSRIKAETDRIMETVQEGLLLIDSNHIIGSQFSAELKTILRTDQLAGLSLLNLLQRLLTEKMYGTTRDYFALLFDIRRKERTVLKVNPLDQVEVHFSNPEGGFTTRHLGFSFRRIVVADRVERVFVSIKDITAQAELERSLREAEKRKDRQLEILLSIIHVDPSELAGFVSMVTKEIEQINGCLKAEEFAAASGQGELLRGRLKRIFASVHNVKGNASVLRLEYFVKGCTDFEARISELLSKPSLGGDDFLGIVVLQSALKTDLAELTELHGRLSKLRGPGEERPRSPSKSLTPEAGLVDTLRVFTHRTAGELGKQAELDIDPLVLEPFGQGRRALLRDVLIQLIRNSLVHSIEDPVTRGNAGKRASSRISVRALPVSEGGLQGLLYRDDGQGLDLERIRARAIQQGLVAADQASALDAGALAAFIFEPGFSTAGAATEHAGRGVGMDIIKSRIVDEEGGELLLRSEPGQYFEFGFYLPGAKAA